MRGRVDHHGGVAIRADYFDRGKRFAVQTHGIGAIDGGGSVDQFGGRIGGQRQSERWILFSDDVGDFDIDRAETIGILGQFADQVAIVGGEIEVEILAGVSDEGVIDDLVAEFAVVVIAGELGAVGGAFAVDVELALNRAGDGERLQGLIGGSNLVEKFLGIRRDGGGGWRRKDPRKRRKMRRVLISWARGFC